MNARFGRLALALTATLLLGARPARASFPATIRARPIAVEIAGTADQPSVIVRGVLSLDYKGFGHVVPTCGSIRWTCRSAPREQSLCRMAWTDLQAAAAEGACVAFGALMWQLPDDAIEPYAVTQRNNPQDARPYDATAAMGVVRIPCHPMPADLDRPDLAIACPPDTTPAPVEPAAVDAGPPIAMGPADPAKATVELPPVNASGGTTGTRDGTAKAGGGSTAGAGGAMGSVPPVALEDNRGCALGGGRRPGAAFALVVLGWALLARRRRDA